MRTVSHILLIMMLSATAIGEENYETPLPHSSGAQVLTYCNDEADVIAQLRCNYYLQGVADLAVQPPLACLPRGMNQSELIEIAVTHLKSVSKKQLEKSSAAGILLPYLRRSYRCPEVSGIEVLSDQKTDKQRFAEAIYKSLAEKNAKASNDAVEAAAGAAQHKSKSADDK